MFEIFKGHILYLITTNWTSQLFVWAMSLVLLLWLQMRSGWLYWMAHSRSDSGPGVSQRQKNQGLMMMMITPRHHLYCHLMMEQESLTLRPAITSTGCDWLVTIRCRMQRPGAS